MIQGRCHGVQGMERHLNPKTRALTGMQYRLRRPKPFTFHDGSAGIVRIKCSVAGCSGRSDEWQVTCPRAAPWRSTAPAPSGGPRRSWRRGRTRQAREPRGRSRRRSFSVTGPPARVTIRSAPHHVSPARRVARHCAGRESASQSVERKRLSTHIRRLARGSVRGLRERRQAEVGVPRANRRR
jgi:hypothetical protein